MGWLQKADGNGACLLHLSFHLQSHPIPTIMLSLIQLQLFMSFLNAPFAPILCIRLSARFSSLFSTFNLCIFVISIFHLVCLYAAAVSKCAYHLLYLQSPGSQPVPHVSTGAGRHTMSCARKGGWKAPPPLQIHLRRMPGDSPVLRQAETRGRVQLPALQLPVCRIRVFNCWGYPIPRRSLERRAQSGYALWVHLQPSICQVKPSRCRERNVDAHGAWSIMILSSHEKSFIALHYKSIPLWFIIAGVQLFWSLLLPSFRSIPTWDGSGVHGISTAHGRRDGGQELQLQPGGWGKRAEADVGGDSPEHTRLSQEGSRQPWWPHHTAQHGSVFLRRWQEGAQAPCHRPDMEGAAEPRCHLHTQSLHLENIFHI